MPVRRHKASVIETYGSFDATKLVSLPKRDNKANVHWYSADSGKRRKRRDRPRRTALMQRPAASVNNTSGGGGDRWNGIIYSNGLVSPGASPLPRSRRGTVGSLQKGMTNAIHKRTRANPPGVFALLLLTICIIVYGCTFSWSSVRRNTAPTPNTATHAKPEAIGVAHLLRSRGTNEQSSNKEEEGDALFSPDLPAYPFPLIILPDDNYDVAAHFTPLGGHRYSEYTTGTAPYHVTAAQRHASDAVARSRRHHIRRAMQHAWSGYVQHAWGMDELRPQSGSGSNNWGGQGITLVDALDTLWLMGLQDEFAQARDWVRDHLDHGKVTGRVSVFETTIRDLGGLLSAYDFSGDVVFLDKAVDLGERLLRAFDNSPTGIPWGQVSLADGSGENAGWTGGCAILSEFTTLQIEFRYLAKVARRPELATQVERVFATMNDIAPPNGLYPNFYSVMVPAGQTYPTPGNDKITFGAMADSFYEYMLKVWLQGGKTEPMYRNMYDLAMDGMHRELLQTSTPSGLVYIADKNYGVLDHKMDHLVCFMGGLLALGAYTDPGGLDAPRAQRDLQTGKALTYTCYQMYARMETGIAPEFIEFQPGQDFHSGANAPHYLLRPEAVESLFILHFLTGDPVYREWGWEIFSALEKYCQTPYGYGGLHDVHRPEDPPEDKMESFFLAETLKYLYLLQDPDTEIDILGKHVFNTEAHPLRLFPLLDAAGV
jgi:Glycosyl hydrolase family 47